MSCDNCSVHSNYRGYNDDTQEFENTLKHISPNFNPGIRQWYGVPHEQHNVEGLNTQFPSYMPQNTPAENRLRLIPVHRTNGLDVPLNSWVPPNALNRQIEGFSPFKEMDITKLLILIIIVCLLWYFLEGKYN